MIEVDIDELLIEDNILPELNEIKYPKKEQKMIKEYPKGTYIFENGEQFKGRIKKEKGGIKLLMGIYKWPNGQQYLGDLSKDNNFTKRGTIIFPNNNKLIGNFIINENKIKSAVFETPLRKYEGSFVNNKLDGRFIIKNTKNAPHYLFKGVYSDGKRHGNFVLEKIFKGKILQLTGIYNYGKKNGIFRVYIQLKDGENKLIYEIEFENDKIKYKYKDKEKIENKNNLFLDKELPYKICCLKVLKYSENRIYILLGSYENIIVFDFNNLNTPSPILIFKKANINDILEMKDKNLLFCSSKNNFKLIEPINFEEETEEIKNDSRVETKTDSIAEEIKIIQEFKGLKTSKSIFVMKELSNGLIASGDCENLILWNKFIDINYYEYKMINYINLRHTYCILEIIKKNNNKNVILCIPQPDTKSIHFININNNYKIQLIKQLENVNTIDNRKNIMKQDNNILFIGCQNSIILIDLNKYEITSKIFFEKVTYLNIFLSKFLLCGIIKNKGGFNYEGYLSQIQLEFDKNRKNNEIINVSKCLNNKHKGSIIDADIFKFDDRDYIVTIGSDNKILILV